VGLDGARNKNYFAVKAQQQFTAMLFYTTSVNNGNEHRVTLFYFKIMNLVTGILKYIDSAEWKLRT
jgi:hypothetical protein